MNLRQTKIQQSVSSLLILVLSVFSIFPYSHSHEERDTHIDHCHSTHHHHIESFSISKNIDLFINNANKLAIQQDSSHQECHICLGIQSIEPIDNSITVPKIKAIEVFSSNYHSKNCDLINQRLLKSYLARDGPVLV